MKSNNDNTNNDGDPTRITAGYIRLTREESLITNLSAPAQRQDILEYAERHELPELTFFEETKAVGGDVPFEKRLAGREMIRLCKEGKVAHIVVRDVDRLTRDLPLWLQLDDLCEQYNVTIHTFSGPLQTASPSDRFATRVRAAAAQLEKEQTGDRIRRAKRQLARQGRHVGGPPPFGYTSQARRRTELITAGMDREESRIKSEEEFPRTGYLYIDKKEEKVVRLVFQLYVRKRWGSRRISNELNRLGHRRRSGKPFHPEKLRRVIGDPVVAGFIPYDEERYRRGRGPWAPKADQHLYPGQHKAIIDEEVWRRAQEIRKANSLHAPTRGNSSFANRRHPLAGVLECGCGGKMRSGSTQNKIRQGSYVCKKRFYYGPDAIGGCSLPRVSIPKAHQAFWSKLGDIIRAPGLVDQVYEASQRELADRERREPTELDPREVLIKLNNDLDAWYDRHYAVESEAEKNAVWQRIKQLLQRQEQLERQIDDEPPPTPKSSLQGITKDRIREHLADLARAIPKSKDGGVALVQALVEHHGLRVQLIDSETMAISMSFRPPGVGTDESVEHAVHVETEAPLPISEVDAWLLKHEGTLKCKLCGKPIDVKRHHYWDRLPETHRECSLAETSRRRANPQNGFLNGEQVAIVLGIGRTTVGRWMKKGKLTPVRKESGVWLFDEIEIRRMAAKISKAAIDPSDGYVNGEEAARILNVSRATIGRLMRSGDLIPEQKRRNVCWFRAATVYRLAETRSPKSAPRKLTYRGQTLTVAEWSKRLGIHKDTIRRRLRTGCSDEEALRPATTGRTLTFNGISHTITEWSEKLGLRMDTIYYRLSTGCTDEEALRPTGTT